MIKALKPIIVCLGISVLMPQWSNGQWVQSKGLIGSSITALATNGTTIFAGTNDSGVCVSANSGESWSAVNSGLPAAGVLAFAVNNGNIFTGTNGNGVFLSTNSGANWNAVNSGLPANATVQALAISDTNIFAGTQGQGVFVSTNNGANWKAVNSGLKNSEVYAFAVGDKKIFTGTDSGGIYLSTNNGASWSASTRIIATWPTGQQISVPILSLFMSGTSLFAGLSGGGGIINYGGGIFRSTDNGATWSDTVGNGKAVTCFATAGTNLFAGTSIIHLLSSSSVYVSKDSGTSWEDFSSGLPSLINVSSLIVCNNYIFAGLRDNSISGGVWRRPWSDVSVNKREKPLPGRPSFIFTSVNRLGSTATITFTIAREEPVSLAIYDLSGREIVSLVNKRLTAGPHAVSWDTRNMAPGCYAARLRAGTHLETRSIPLSR